MGFFNELNKFIKSVLSWFYFLISFSFFFFLFGLKEVELFQKNFVLPLPTFDSFSVQIFKIIQQDLLPVEVELVVTSPLTAFLAQITISLLLAFILIFPYFLYKIIGFFLPALSAREKKAVILTLFPSLFLFFIGCFFAYFFLIPLTFRTLYPYATVMGAIPFFSVQEFIALVFGMMIAVGLMFLLPIFMIFLTSLKIISPDFWRKNWNYAILIFLIFSAIITPDGTGISMIVLFVPLAGLYLLGAVITGRKTKIKNPEF